MTTHQVAICVYGLSENWLGGVNYFRNLMLVFDAAQVPDMRLHVLTDDPSFAAGLNLSPRVQLHHLSMMKHRTPAWVLRKAIQRTTGRDLLMLRYLRRLGVGAVAFSEIAGAAKSGVRCVPWIPDFQFKHHPELFPAKGLEAEQQRAERFLRDHDGLIVSSQNAREDAIGLFGARSERVHVLRFAPKVDFDQLTSPTVRDEVFARHGIDRPYFFLPNQYWQHKNHRVVAEAVRLLADRSAPVPLVISTGKTSDHRSPTYFAEFEAFVKAHHLDPYYRILGVISRVDMMVLLAHSVAVLNPSRFEGWSTTVEEAKALGKRVLVSDIAVHREQVAEVPGAELFGVDDAEALAALLLRHQHEGSAADTPPQPNHALYATFSRQFIGFLQRLAAPAPA